MKNKKVLVVGIGKTGVAVTESLLSLGAQVTVQDSRNREKFEEETLALLDQWSVESFLGEKPKNLNFNMVVLSPGVPPTLDFILGAESAGAEVIGELELAYRLGKGNYVGITGTNGKTTTTTLVGEIFERGKKKTRVVGNIGVAITKEALASDDDTWLVTEISSFQLERIKTFRPKVAAILNLTPDHLDRHGNMENYGKAKGEIFKNQEKEDFLVVNFDDKKALNLATGTKSTIVPFSREESLKFGGFLKKEVLTVRDREGKEFPICHKEELQILGDHNVENALAASCICFFSGVDVESIREGIKSFQGVAHRIEFCRELNGTKYINDSKGTNVNAAIKAINAVPGKVILIGGGYDKQGEFDELVEAFPEKVKKALLMGSTAVKIKDAAEKHGFNDTIILENMEACVDEAYRIAAPGDTVLLSPACASWDMYKSYEVRGNHFKECVNKLEG